MVFQLHPSFDNPMREYTHPPYEITETGWGEFEIAVIVGHTACTEQFLHPAAQSNIAIALFANLVQHVEGHSTCQLLGMHHEHRTLCLQMYSTVCAGGWHAS